MKVAARTMSVYASPVCLSQYLYKILPLIGYLHTSTCILVGGGPQVCTYVHATQY